MNSVNFQVPSFTSKNETFWRKVIKKGINDYSTSLFEARKDSKNALSFVQNHAVNKSFELEHFIQEIDRKRKKLLLEWDELNERELLLKKLVMEFNEFTTTNNLKRHKALERLNEYKARIIKSKEMIANISLKNQTLRNVINLMKIQIKKLSIYEKILTDTMTMKSYVKKTSFNNIEMLLYVVVVFEDSKKSIMKKYDEIVETYGNISFIMQKSVEKISFSLVALKNKTMELRQSYDASLRKSRKFERLCEEIVTESRNQLLNRAILVDSIVGFNEVIKKNSAHRVSIPKDDLIALLYNIKTEMETRHSILEKINGERSYLGSNE